MSQKARQRILSELKAENTALAKANAALADQLQATASVRLQKLQKCPQASDAKDCPAV